MSLPVDIPEQQSIIFMILFEMDGVQTVFIVRYLFSFHVRSLLCWLFSQHNHHFDRWLRLEILIVNPPKSSMPLSICRNCRYDKNLEISQVVCQSLFPLLLFLCPFPREESFKSSPTLGLTQGSDVINLLFANAIHVCITMGWDPRVITLAYV